jgi:ribosomal protein L16/L10AE
MLTEIRHRVLEHKKKQATRIMKKKGGMKIGFKKILKCD